MKSLRLFALVGTSLCALAGSAVAAPPTHPETPTAPVPGDRFEAMLRSIDIVPPDRASLEGAFPDAWQRLDAVARDAKRDQWSRIRAVSLLSYFVEARTRATLEAVSTDGDKEVRRQAIYTLGRGFGAAADLALVRFIEARTTDADVDVAEHALRSLRWVDHPEAKVVLERVAQKGPAKLRDLARVTSDKRELRLKGAPRGH